MFEKLKGSLLAETTILVLVFSVATALFARQASPNNQNGILPATEACIEGALTPLPNAKELGTASVKEKFELATKMLDRYEGTISGLMNANVTLYVVIIGWAIASKDARQTLATLPQLLSLSMAVLTIVMVLYAVAINHWLWRWESIKDIMDGLNYMEPECYPGYDLPPKSWLGYFAPVGVLYLFVMVFLLAIGQGKYFDPQTGQANRLFPTADTRDSTN